MLADLSIHIKNLSVKYGDTFGLRGVNLSIRKGEKVLLVGSTGSGKTTLLLSIAGLIPSLFKAHFEGSVKVSGRVGLLLQDFEAQLLGLTVEEEVLTPVKNIGGSPEILNVLEDLGVERRYFVARLSYGQKQIVALASVLATQPNILLLDEPTSQLDREAALKFLRMMLSSPDTVIVSEHDYAEVYQMFDRMVALESGEVIYDGKPIPPDINLSHWKVSSSEKTVISAENLSCGWEKEVIRANFAVSEGEIMSIFGPNGSGKTTLLLTLAGFLRPLRGCVRRAGRVYMVFQNPDRNLTFSSVLEEVVRPAKLAFGKKGEDIAIKIVEAFGLSRIVDRRTFRLSRGERTLLALASAIAAKPKILLLDEPTFGLDYSSLKFALDVILEFAEEFGMAVILATCKFWLARRFRMLEAVRRNDAYVLHAES